MPVKPYCVSRLGWPVPGRQPQPGEIGRLGPGRRGTSRTVSWHWNVTPATIPCMWVSRCDQAPDRWQRVRLQALTRVVIAP